MQCHTASELLSVQLDSRLAEDEREELRQHLAGCERCRQELQWLERADALFQGVTLAAPPPQLAEVIMARVQRRAARMAMLRGGVILLLGVIILLGMVFVPLAAFHGPMATVSSSPSTVSALVGLIVRTAGILSTLLQAAYLVLRAVVASPCIAALVVYTVGAAALALWWVRIVAGPRAGTLHRRTG